METLSERYHDRSTGRHRYLLSDEGEELDLFMKLVEILRLKTSTFKVKDNHIEKELLKVEDLICKHCIDLYYKEFRSLISLIVGNLKARRQFLVKSEFLKNVYDVHSYAPLVRYDKDIKRLDKLCTHSGLLVYEREDITNLLMSEDYKQCATDYAHCWRQWVVQEPMELYFIRYGTVEQYIEVHLKNNQELFKCSRMRFIGLPVSISNIENNMMFRREFESLKTHLNEFPNKLNQWIQVTKYDKLFKNKDLALHDIVNQQMSLTLTQPVNGLGNENNNTEGLTVFDEYTDQDDELHEQFEKLVTQNKYIGTFETFVEEKFAKFRSHMLLKALLNPKWLTKHQVNDSTVTTPHELTPPLSRTSTEFQLELMQEVEARRLRRLSLNVDYNSYYRENLNLNGDQESEKDDEKAQEEREEKEGEYLSESESEDETESESDTESQNDNDNQIQCETDAQGELLQESARGKYKFNRLQWNGSLDTENTFSVKVLLNELAVIKNIRDFKHNRGPLYTLDDCRSVYTTDYFDIIFKYFKYNTVKSHEHFLKLERADNDILDEKERQIYRLLHEIGHIPTLASSSSY